MYTGTARSSEMQKCGYGAKNKEGFKCDTAVVGAKRLLGHNQGLETSIEEKATEGYFAHRKHLGLRSPQTTLLLRLEKPWEEGRFHSILLFFCAFSSASAADHQ